MFPFTLPRNEAKQNVNQQRRPYLPANRILVVANKIGELQSLFDLLEENFYRPCEIIRYESHLFRFAVDEIQD